MEWTASYNSLFFSIYQFAGMFGNILASVILLSLGELAWARDVLFVTLGIVSLLGAFLFIAMPSVEGADDKHPSLLDTSRLAFTDARMALMIPDDSFFSCHPLGGTVPGAEAHVEGP